MYYRSAPEAGLSYEWQASKRMSVISSSTVLSGSSVVVPTGITLICSFPPNSDVAWITMSDLTSWKLMRNPDRTRHTPLR